MCQTLRGVWFLAVLVLICGGCQPSSTVPPIPAGKSAGSSPSSNGIAAVAPSDVSKPVNPPVTKSEPEVSPSSSPAVEPRFVNVAADAGIAFTFFNDAVHNRFFLPEVMGGGAGWLDFDQDGWWDLYLANGTQLQDPDPHQKSHVSRLYRNRGDGHFDDVTFLSDAWHNGYGQGIAIGDYDADGFPDIYESCYGKNVVFRNNGDGTFSNVTDESRVGNDLWGSSSVWHDVDGDGWLDLFVVNYLLVTLANKKICDYGGVSGYCGPGSYEAAPDRVYINQGDGTFVDRADELGFNVEGGKGLAIIALDLDDDQLSEIYVLNDMMENFLFTRSSTHDELLENTSKRRLYANVASYAGCAVSDTGLHEASMGVACLDFDDDFHADMYLAHYYAAKNTLYRNLGKLVFHDDSRRTRVAATSWEFLGFGTVALDYDRDRRDDIFVTNGHVLGPLNSPNEMRPLLLRNVNGRFVEDTAPLAGEYFRDVWLGRGAAGGDFDNDGDVDIAVTHLDRPFALLRNDTQTGRHFVGLDLRTADRLPLAGGRVIVSANGKKTLVPLFAGGSYLSCSDPRVLIGLGDAQQATVEVFWPGGGSDTFDLAQVDCYWRIQPGKSPEVVDYKD